MIWLYSGFLALVLILLALDLGVFHRKAHVVSMREALGWSAFWICVGLLFSGFVFLGYENHWLGLGLTPDMMGSVATNVAGVGTVYNDGASATMKYLTGYLVEKSLSVDNIFVISMIFSFIAVPPIYQHRVLFWGILGALLMRGADDRGRRRYDPALFVDHLRIRSIPHPHRHQDAVSEDSTLRPQCEYRRSTHPTAFPGNRAFPRAAFFVRAGSTASGRRKNREWRSSRTMSWKRLARGTLLATPLFLGLVLIEFTDLIFAVDSIPAIFAITSDPFLVFTSNVFALLGLRSLYFALAGMIEKFRYLKVSLAFVLLLVGIKMMAHTWLRELLGDSFNLFVLAAVVLILAAGVMPPWLRQSGMSWKAAKQARPGFKRRIMMPEIMAQ